VVLSVARNMDKYYHLVDIKKAGNMTLVLLMFKLPPVSSNKRKKIIEKVLDESDADALIEFFWTKGSIIYKDRYQFYAILVFSDTDKISSPPWEHIPASDASSDDYTRA
jgi:hypothetical protein